MDEGGSHLERNVVNAALHIVRDDGARVSRADFQGLRVDGLVDIQPHELALTAR